ncbi:MAG: FAD:protein FMN transferase [Chitinophagaceae bacterium]
MLYFCLPIFFLINLFSVSVQERDQEPHFITGNAQGTSYQITYIHNEEVVTKNQVDSILNKIDSSLSLYKSYSLINRFNNSSGGCKVEDHFIKVVKRSIQTFEETDGDFDITVKPLVQAWGFGVNAINSMPDSADIIELKKCTGSGNLRIEKNELRKTKSCVQIDCNGIAQGYSVDVIADFLEKNKIKNYLVELGGEIRVKGKNQHEKQWTVGIERPGDDADFLPVERIIYLDNGGITTSGSYRKFFTKGSKNYSHIINPVTGYPVDNGMISVTVIANDAITADAYDNAFMVMGIKKSFEYLAHRKDMEAFFVYKKNDGIINDTATKGFYNYLNIKK